jgi:hypothetical protein
MSDDTPSPLNNVITIDGALAESPLSGTARVGNTSSVGWESSGTSGSIQGLDYLFSALRREGLIADELVLQLATFLRSLDLFLELTVRALPRTLTTNQVRRGSKQGTDGPEFSRIHSSTTVRPKSHSAQTSMKRTRCDAAMRERSLKLLREPNHHQRKSDQKEERVCAVVLSVSHVRPAAEPMVARPSNPPDTKGGNASVCP